MRAGTVAAVASGFVLGWLARDRTANGSRLGVSPDKRARMDADDRHDVLPTDDELTYTEQEADRNAAAGFVDSGARACRAQNAWNYLCTQPAGHSGPHFATGPQHEVYDTWFGT